MFLQTRHTARFMIVRFSLIMLLPAVAYSNAQVVSGKPTRFQSPTSSAYIRPSDGAFVTDNSLFEFANVLHDDGSGYTRLLLLKNVHNEHVDGREETIGRIAVQAWTMSRDKTRTRRWSFQAVGNDGEALYNERFFRVAEWGCCDWPTVYSYFSLLSGEKLFVSNGDLLEINGTDGGPQVARYVAFGFYAHSTPPTLQYGSDTKVQQRCSLLSSRKYYDAPKLFISANDKLLKSALLKGPFSFAIVMRYEDGVEIRVPVQNDIVQFDKAVLPAGYSFQADGTGRPPTP